MSGAVLPLERTAADELLSELRQLLAAAPEVVGTALDEADAKAPAEALAELAAAIGLRSAAPIFTAAWLQHSLEQIRNPRLPTLLNSDGEEIVFITLRYTMVKGKRTSQLRAALDALPDLAPATATFWN